ncbi:hypothetical protein F5Y17DRAFT_345671 [Xylariaceae sp. FL0594]|nr:hypothetical protein F5Y17DRAFT_345671 [Xylariaceae sp. FL0594]
MSWGSSKPVKDVHVSRASTLSQLVPLLILLAVVAGVAFVGYQIYVGATKIRQNAEHSFAAHNVVFTKEGVKVGVRHMENERYVDATQSWVVKAWNAGSSGSHDGGTGSTKKTTATKRK